MVFGLGLAEPVKAATTIFFENFDSCYANFANCSSGVWQEALWAYSSTGGWNDQSYPAKYKSPSYYAIAPNNTYSYNYQGSALYSPYYNYNSSATYNINFYTGVAASGSCKLEVGTASAYSTSPGGTGYATLATYTINNVVPNNSPGSYVLKQLASKTVPAGKKYIVFVAYGCTSGVDLLLEDVTIIENPPADTTPPTVGQTSPTSATVNVATTFSASVSDNVSVSSCNLYADGVSQGAMSGPPCTSCTASRSHTFTTTGTHTMYARCSDAAGNTTNGTSVNVNVASGVSPSTVTTDIATISVPTQLQNNQTTLKGTITNTGGATVTQIRFMWSNTSGGPYTNTACSSSGTFTGAFSCDFTLTGITPGNTNIYYYKAQAYNSAGWSDLASTNEKRVAIYLRDGGQQQFTTLINYALNVTILPSNSAGNVQSSPSGINCGNGYSTCSASFSGGTYVTLTASPATGYSFSSWSGCDSSSGVYCYVTMSSAKNVTATFTINNYALNVTILPSNSAGNVQSSPSGINCGNGYSTCSASFSGGTYVTLTASPATGYSFSSWSGCDSSSGVYCYVTMSSAKNVTATFSNNPPTCTNVFASPTSGDVPLDIIFTGAGSDPGGSISAYQLDFNGDGTWDTTTTDNFIGYIYASAATYCVKLRVQDNLGAWSTNTGSCPGGTCTIQITVTTPDQPPQVLNPTISNKNYCTSFQGHMTISFSWTYYDPDGNPGSRFQFRINDVNNVDAPNPKVDSDYTTGIPNNTTQTQTVSVSINPGVNELSYNYTYYWWVRVWDNQGNNSGWVQGPGE